MIEKAPYGHPCNSCGRCCAEALCPLASKIFGAPLNAPGPCPALLINDTTGLSSCGVVARPRDYAPVRTAQHGATVMRGAALKLIGAGFGCDGLVEGEKDDPDFRQRMHSYSSGERIEVAIAMRLWGM